MLFANFAKSMSHAPFCNHFVSGKTASRPTSIATKGGMPRGETLAAKYDKYLAKRVTTPHAYYY